MVTRRLPPMSGHQQITNHQAVLFILDMCDIARAGEETPEFCLAQIQAMAEMLEPNLATMGKLTDAFSKAFPESDEPKMSARERLDEIHALSCSGPVDGSPRLLGSSLLSLFGRNRKAE